MEKYNEIKKSLRTGDIIFFHGGEFISTLIGKIEKQEIGDGDYTHVGIIILSNIFPQDHPYYNNAPVPYIFESTQSGPLSDGILNLDKKAFLGVQIRNLDEVIEAFIKNKNKVAIGKTHIDINSNTIFEEFKKYNGIRYDFNVLDLLASAYPRLRFIRNAYHSITKHICKKSWLFCSELLTKIYQDIGLISNKINSENIVPIDFLPEYQIKNIGIELVKEIIKLE